MRLVIPFFIFLNLAAVSANNRPYKSNRQAGPIAYWLGGVDPVVMRDWHKSERAGADFMDLFKPDAPWHQSSSKVAVFKISIQFASRSSDADLAVLINDLHRRGIKLAIEMGMLENDRGCGKGEGYMPKNLPAMAMKRIQHFGGQIDYVAMDEVVFFGHERYWADKQGPACQDSIGEIVREVAATVAVIHQYFPQAQIGAVEPITGNQGFDPHRLAQDYLSFADNYRSVTGSNLAFFHADIAWRSVNWQAGIAPIKEGMRARGIRFGIIIGGNPDYKDNVSWTRAGLNQLRMLAANPATAPEDVIIQSWQPFPTNFLPETKPGTSTWMLLEAEKTR